MKRPFIHKFHFGSRSESVHSNQNPSSHQYLILKNKVSQTAVKPTRQLQKNVCDMLCRHAALTHCQGLLINILHGCL
uniref:Uncharacterized protein n=1 Tax=Physcomitrium patens TaxID=3218 RepID=A0A2K1JYC7_PHYPA|nr:hypothetical protein PHYPA_013648 [Physcomitrium patens]